MKGGVREEEGVKGEGRRVEGVCVMCVPLSKVTSKSVSLACTRRPAHFSSRENVPQRLMTSSRISSFTLGSCKGGDEEGGDEETRRWRMRE